MKTFVLEEITITPFLPATPSLSELIRNKLDEYPSPYWALNDTWCHYGVLSFQHPKMRRINVKFVFDQDNCEDNGDFMIDQIRFVINPIGRSE